MTSSSPAGMGVIYANSSCSGTTSRPLTSTDTSPSPTSTSPAPSPTFLPGEISRVAIIGAGPVGVAFAKYLLAEKDAFSEIVIYEQRDNVGGIWNLSGNEISGKVPMPQGDPYFGTGGISGEDALEFESPLYEYLETNIPKQLMAFSDTPFPEDEPLFPGHKAVLRYLERYADDVRHLIRFRTKVSDIKLLIKGFEDIGAQRQKDVWDISIHDLRTGTEKTEHYDAVVVANGHYTVPSIPAITGLENFQSTYSGSGDGKVLIVHSKAYRRPQDFANKKKVLVIGNSASGLDIAAQIGKAVRENEGGQVWLSARSESAFGTAEKVSWRRDVGEVVEFLAAAAGCHRAVRFRDGQVESGFDAVVFATGYFYNFPFLKHFDERQSLTNTSRSGPLITDGLRIRGLYQHLFQIEHPTLVFPVVNLKVIPFPLSQNQAAVVSRIWASRMNLPSQETMRQWEKQLIEQKGDGKYFHLKRFPEDAAQINELYTWADEAKKLTGLENAGIGKLGAIWDERLVWMRSRFPDIKAAFAKKGEGRFSIKAMEDLGFSFEEWKDKTTQDGRRMFTEAKCPSVSRT